ESRTWVRSTATCVSASNRPAPKLASNAHNTLDAGVAAAAMLQYPDAALCTELWNRVGESCRSPEASVMQISLQLEPSPLDDEKTVGNSEATTPARETASKLMASANRTTAPVRRRSAGGRAAGGGSTVGRGA